MNREAIYQALFTLVDGLAQFKTKGRRLKAFTEIPAESQPAFFQVQQGENADVKEGAPNRWLLNVSLVVYVNVGESDETVSTTALNPILDAITSALEPTPSGGRQTLGGLVRYARISGSIEIDEALLGAQVMAVIPVEILTERDWSVAPA